MIYLGDLKKEIGDRLKRARETRNLKQNRVALSLGIHNSTLAKYESGDREPDNETLNKLANMYEVSPNWILTGKNELITEYPLPYGAIPYEPAKMVRLPILGTIRAGEPIDMIRNIEGYEFVEPELLRGRQGFVLRVKGDSMSGDRILDGDLVVVICQEEAHQTDIAVVAINGQEATLKRVKCQGDMCMLIPSNPAYEPLLVPSNEVHIIGIVEEVKFKPKRL